MAKMALLPPDPVFCLKTPHRNDAFHSLCFHTPERLYAGTAQGTVQLWDLQTNRSTYQLAVGKSPILSLAHPEDALITQEKEGPVKLWELTNSAYVLRHQTTTEHMGFCRFVYHKDAVIIPRGTSDISILCAQTFVERQVLSGALVVEAKYPSCGTVTCLVPVEIQDKSYLLAAYESGTVALWDLESSKPISQLEMGDPTECLLAMDYDPQTNRGVCGGVSNKISVFSINRPSMELSKTSEITIKNPSTCRLKIRKDRKVFASTGSDGRIRIFSWKSMRPLAVLTEHKSEVLDVVYSEDKVSMWKAVIMAAGGMDGRISLWNLYN